MHLTLLLQVLITLIFAQLNDVVLTFAAGVLRVYALLEVLLAACAGAWAHHLSQCTGVLPQ